MQILNLSYQQQYSTKQFLKPRWFSVRTNEVFCGHFNKIKLVDVLI